MKKSYFSHDINARNDEKMIRLRMRNGMAGVGVFWCLCERLCEENNYSCSQDYEAIAFELRCDASLVQSVVEDFGLFVIDGGKFWSNSMRERMEKKNEVSRARAEAAQQRWNDGQGNKQVQECKNVENECKCNANASKTDANAMQMHEDENLFPPAPPITKVKESKEKKINPLPEEGGEGGGGFSNILERMEQSAQGVLKLGGNEDDADRFVKLMNLGEFPMMADEYVDNIGDLRSLMDKWEVDAAKGVFPSTTLEAVKAAKRIGAIIAEKNEQDDLINMFNRGTREQKHKGAKRMNELLTQIERKKGTKDEIRYPFSYIKKLYNS